MIRILSLRLDGELFLSLVKAALVYVRIIICLVIGGLPSCLLVNDFWFNFWKFRFVDKSYNCGVFCVGWT